MNFKICPKILLDVQLKQNLKNRDEAYVFQANKISSEIEKARQNNSPIEYSCSHENDVRNIIKKIQEKTKNTKVVYTLNTNLYDYFWDIDDEYVEQDTDYIYISTSRDSCMCRNFHHIFIEKVEQKDPFLLNRKFKFNKRLFAPYEKALYIDANVRINKKLSKYFHILNLNEYDMVLFTHPIRYSTYEEIDYLRKHSKNLKWNYDDKKMQEFKNKHFDSQLYWLNVHLSNTKHNYFQNLLYSYREYKLKRDQVLFGSFAKKIRIFKIYIKPWIPKNVEKVYTDPAYGYVKSYSNCFNRPLGGYHFKNKFEKETKSKNHFFRKKSEISPKININLLIRITEKNKIKND